jgi:hypothetical protein
MLFCNTVRFYVEDFLPPRPYSKVGEDPFPAVRDCLIQIFAVAFHIGGRSYIRNLRTRCVVETRTHLSQSNCNKCKIYKLHGLTFVWLGDAVLANEVTIVVNCYGVASPSDVCCKSDVSGYNCVDINLEFKYCGYFLWGKTGLHVVHRQFTKFCSNIPWTISQQVSVSFFWQISKYLRKDFCVFLVNWENW